LRRCRRLRGSDGQPRILSPPCSKAVSELNFVRIEYF
jgi:hypothetical protein